MAGRNPKAIEDLSHSERVEMIPKLMHILQNDSASQKEKEEAAFSLRKLSSIDRDEEILKELVSHNCIPLLVSLLENTPSRIRYEALWTLTNLSADSTQEVVQAGAVPRMLNLVDPSLDAETVTQAVWGLGNIVGDGNEMRDLVVKQGLVPRVVAVLEHYPHHNELRNQSCWMMSSLSRHLDSPDDQEIFQLVMPLLPMLPGWLRSEDESVSFDALTSLRDLSEHGSHVNELLNLGIVPDLIKFLSNRQSRFVRCALTTLGEMCSSEEDNSAVPIILQHGFLEAVKPLLSHEHREIRKIATWAISNIAAGDHVDVYSVEAVRQSGVLEVIVKRFPQEVASVQTEALYAIDNCMENGPPHMPPYFYDMGVLRTVVGTAVSQSVALLHDLEAKEEEHKLQKEQQEKEEEEEDTEDESLFSHLTVGLQILDKIFAVGAIKPHSPPPPPEQQQGAEAAAQEEEEEASTDPIESNRIVKEVMAAGDFTSCLEQLRLLKESALLRRKDPQAHSDLNDILASYFGDENEEEGEGD